MNPLRYIYWQEEDARGELRKLQSEMLLLKRGRRIICWSFHNSRSFSGFFGSWAEVFGRDSEKGAHFSTERIVPDL